MAAQPKAFSPDADAVRSDIRRFNEMLTSIRSDHNKWMMGYKKFYAYCVPSRIDKDECVDEIGQVAAWSFAKTVYRLLMPDNWHWFNIELSAIAKYHIEQRYGEGSDGAKRAIKKIEDELAGYTRLVLAMLASSNKRKHFLEALAELSMGNGCVLFQGKRQRAYEKSPFIFSLVRMEELLMSASYDEVNFIGREFLLKRRDLKNYWPDANVPTMEQVKMAGKFEDTVTVVDVCVKRGETWKNFVYIKDDATKEFLSEEDHEYCPYIVFGMRPDNASSPYCVGPISGGVLEKVIDVCTLAKGSNFSSSAAAYGIWAAEDGSIAREDFDMTPWAINFLRKMSNNDPGLRRLDTGVPIDVEAKVARMKADIADALSVSLKGGASMEQSADEAAMRRNDAHADMREELYGLINQICVPLYNRAIEILKYNGMVDKIAIPMKKYDGSNTEAKELPYVGKWFSFRHKAPMSTGAESSIVRAIASVIQLANGIGGTQLSGIVLKIEEIIKYVARETGVPEELIRQEADSEKMANAIAAANRAALEQQGAA